MGQSREGDGSEFLVGSQALPRQMSAAGDRYESSLPGWPVSELPIAPHERTGRRCEPYWIQSTERTSQRLPGDGMVSQ